MERIEAFLDGLPGYTGYRDKESRRDSDRRLRESVANQLEAIAKRVERAGAQLANERRLQEVGGVEELVRSLNHTANLVRTQSYGYGGIFTDTPVDERALNQLYLFDKGLALKVSQLDSRLAGIESTITSGESVADALQQAKSSIQGIVDQISARSAVVESAAPAATRSLFSPVEEAAATPPPPIEIQVGDAIAWFDEDYLVDAVIDIRDRDSRARFFHIDTGPDRWLAIAEHGERVIALLDEQGAASSQGTSSNASVVWNFSGSGQTRHAEEKAVKADAAVTFYVLDDESDQVAFRLLSGTDERYLTGKRVHPDDLSIYGKPGKS